MNTAQLSSIIHIFIPVFVALFLIAVACAALVLAAENDIESDKYYLARKINKHSIDYYSDNTMACDKVYRFVNVLYEVFPKDFIIIPNVKLDKLLDEKNIDSDAKKQVLGIGIFYKNYLPLLVIDLIDKNNVNESMIKFTKDVVIALQEINIPIAQVYIEDNYDISKLKQSLLELMPAKIKNKYLK